MCARRSASPTVPTLSIRARFSWRVALTISSTIPTCAGSILARNSECRTAVTKLKIYAFLKHGIAYRFARGAVITKKKKESAQFRPGFHKGVVAKPGVSPDASAGDDAAADAGHQAATALQP